MIIGGEVKAFVKRPVERTTPSGILVSARERFYGLANSFVINELFPNQEGGLPLSPKTT